MGVLVVYLSVSVPLYPNARPNKDYPCISASRATPATQRVVEDYANHLPLLIYEALKSRLGQDRLRRNLAMGSCLMR